MKPLVLHIVVLSAVILSLQAEAKEANVKSSRNSLDYQNLPFDNSYNDIDHPSAYYLHSRIEDATHELILSESSNEAHESEEEVSQPEAEVESLFPYKLYSKVKFTLPPSTKYEQHVLSPVLVDAPVPVKILIDQPYPVEKSVPVYYPVKVNKPYPVNKYVAIPVEVNVPVEERYPIYKDIPVPVPVYVEKPVPKFVEQPYPVPVYKKKGVTDQTADERELLDEVEIQK